MVEIEQQIITALSSAFTGIVVKLEVMPSGRISGSVVWEYFNGCDDAERQRMIRDVLQRQLGQDSTTVGVLLTYTPEELEEMNAA